MNPYQQYNPYTARTMQSPGINWVQGIEGAKAWQLIPNSNVLLMDSENDNTFYIKISDNIGMCTLRIFKYTEVQDTPKASSDMSQYITRDELMEILDSKMRGNNNGKQFIQSNDASKSNQQRN